jgi:hypothetical protein
MPIILATQEAEIRRISGEEGSVGAAGPRRERAIDV